MNLNHRLNPLTSSIRQLAPPLALTAGLFMAIPMASADSPRYECKASNGGWACTKNGIPLPKIEVQPQRTVNKTQNGVINQSTSIAVPVAEKKPKFAVITPPPAPVVEKKIDDGSTREGLDDHTDWKSCKKTFPVPEQSIVENPTSIYVYADAVSSNQDLQTDTFEGNVYVRQGADIITADKAIYDREKGTMTTSGNVLFANPTTRVQGETLDYNVDEKTGKLSDTAYRVPGTRSRGTSDSVTFSADKVSYHENITYTTCSPGDNAWHVQAEKLKVDQNEGMAHATNAWIKIADVPVFYIPKISFPIDDKRHTGLLVPSIGHSSKGGFDISTPYYFNIAPDLDFTFVPRFIEKRGFQLGGEVRSLSETTRLNVAADFIGDDSLYTGKNKDRGQIKLQANSTWDSNWTSNVDLGWTSDDDYISDVGGGLASSSISQLDRVIQAGYASEQVQFSVKMRDYQMLSSTAKPFKLLPQLRMNWDNGKNLSAFADITNFEKKNSVDGIRVHAQPSITFPMERQWGFIRPRLTGFFSGYSLNAQTAGLSSEPTVAAGSFSLDNGLYYDRNTEWFGDSVQQTLEPRLKYLYTSFDDQSAIPNFDSGEPTQTFSGLFHENRFSGYDRIGDTSQITAAVTTRMLDNESGRELFSASIGQTYFLKDRKVGLSGTTLATQSSSSILAEATINPSNILSSTASIEWDPDSNIVEQALLQTRYKDGEKRVLNASYRLNTNNNQTTDISGSWPLSNKTSAIWRWNYSLKDKRHLDTLAGIEYGDCCWKLRFVVDAYSDDSANGSNLGYYIQLQLDGLGNLGNSLQNLLEEKISGYEFN